MATGHHDLDLHQPSIRRAPMSPMCFIRRYPEFACTLTLSRRLWQQVGRQKIEPFGRGAGAPKRSGPCGSVTSVAEGYGHFAAGHWIPCKVKTGLRKTGTFGAKQGRYFFSTPAPMRKTGPTVAGRTLTARILGPYRYPNLKIYSLLRYNQHGFRPLRFRSIGGPANPWATEIADGHHRARSSLSIR